VTAPPPSDRDPAAGREQLAAAEEARDVIRDRRYTLPSRLYLLLDALLAEYDRRGDLINASPGGLMMRTSIAQFEATLAKVESDTTTAMLDETAAALERAESDLAQARDRIAALEAVAGAARTVVEEDQAKPGLGQSISVWRASRRQALDALAAAVRALGREVDGA
jgi:hypothetical protein